MLQECNDKDMLELAEGTGHNVQISNTSEKINDFQQFLDSQQYSAQSITRYEKIFGEGYVSTGGQETTTEFVERLQLKEGDRVLDVGCGIGGGDFYMAKNFGAKVVGIDLSTNMVHFAVQKATCDSSLDVQFEVCDATKKEYPEASFDVVYSRDTILHIEDKKDLFAKFFRWLKPGGKLCISDYCCGPPPHEDRFKTYVAGRGYHLLTPAEYGDVISSVGFTDVSAEDRTQQFVGILKKELGRTKDQKQEFIAGTSQDDYDDIINGWESKVERCADGDQRWGLFYAKKPDNNSFQQFLDTQQYTNRSITRYEKIFGDGYVSPGGQDTTTEFVERLNLKKGDRVLDVGCGIGGGDFYMAKEFGAVVEGIDLSSNMVNFAIERARKYPGLDVKFDVRDATTVQYPDNSFDVIYSRDTILHIEDKKALFADFLKWLKPGGKLCISDYCCGEKPHTDRFEKYVASRGYHLLTPAEYGDVISSAGFTDVSAEDRTQQFIGILKKELGRTKDQKQEFIAATSQDDYDDILNGWESKVERCAAGDQRWGLFYARKPDSNSFQQFLDAQQYSNRSIARYEKIFGDGYVSTGGQETTTEFVERLSLKKGDRVLDVGCGIGGGDFYMAKDFGAVVEGIDLSSNMVNFAVERAKKYPGLDVKFDVRDATTVEYPENSFDVIYSRDTILHIEDKKALFANFFKWLKPGGKLCISDYCCGEKPHTDRFDKYVAGRGYHLLTPTGYGEVISSVGFADVSAEDRTDQFVQVLKKELEKTESVKDAFIAETCEKDYNEIVDGWSDKVVRCADGDQKWGLFYATKPSN